MISVKSAKLQHQEVLEVHAVEYETAISDSIEKFTRTCISLLQVATMSFLVLLNSALVNSNRISSVYMYVIHLSLQFCTLSTIGCMAKPLHVGLFQMNCSIACKCGSVCTY